MTKYPAAFDGLNWYQQLYDWALVDQHPLKTTLTDKIAMREWVMNTVGPDISIPDIYCVAEDLDELHSLIINQPHPQVAWVKANCDSGSSAPIRCTDTTVQVLRRNRQIDLRDDDRLMLQKDHRWRRYERLNWYYRKIPFKIFTEQHLGMRLRNYLFMCSHGRVGVCHSSRPFKNVQWADNICVDREMRPIHWAVDYVQNEISFDEDVPFHYMVELVEAIAAHHPFMRVDLYWINNKIWLGEIGFTPNMSRPDWWRVDEDLAFKLLPVPDLSLATT